MPVSLSIHSNIRDYVASFEDSAQFIDALAQLPNACFVIDGNVWSIYGTTLLRNLPPEHSIVLPISEDRKTLDTVRALYDRLVEMSAKKNLTMISFGGGILQDVSGFAASTIYRGIDWIFVPTTLLAQADSCIGSKTSLNYGKYKNLIGTFFPPNRVHIYPPFLATQLDSDFYSGVGEVIKLHLMGGESDFREIVRLAPDLLRRDSTALLIAIQRSLEIKLSYMANDEFDRGRRNLLNFGHDFGHALESTSDFAVPHGQAVVFGMLASNIIAEKRGLLANRLAADIAEHLLLPSLVAKPSAQSLDPATMISAMKKDKKRIGAELALIMMGDGFRFTRVNDLTEAEVTWALDVLGSTLLLRR
jgi:3-dehydroquinate synthase